MTQKLYKYRSLDNWKWAIDIIVNSRLYAATFKSLNDPMEGRYYYFGKNVADGFRKAISQSKNKNHICSLSKDCNNTLLWSYYASGHTGVAFGVEVVNGQSELEVRDVTYDSGVHIGPNELAMDPDLVALNILSQKQLAWEHEKEVRVFASINFVPVQLTELVLGVRVSPADEELITAVARQWHPGITVTKLHQHDLDRPEAVNGDETAVLHTV